MEEVLFWIENAVETTILIILGKFMDDFNNS